MSAPLLSSERLSDMQIEHQAQLRRIEKRQRLDLVHQAVMYNVRELLAARSLAMDTTPYLERLEALHAVEIQEREGL